MNHDEVMWNVMGQGFCSFKVKTRDDKVRFCRSPYNQTGLCSRATCPLSNAQYATVIEHEDELYLYIKTAERAHLPRRQWEKVKLDTSFPKALEQIDEQLQWWDRRHVNKVKARLLRLKQYLMRKRRMMLEPQPEFVSVNKRQEHKLLAREAKAEKAARIELEIERELLDRLKKGAYDSVVNYNAEMFDKMLDDEQVAEDEEMEEDADLEDYEMDDEDYDEDEELEYETEQGAKGKKSKLPTQFLMDDEVDDDDDDGDDGDESGGAFGAITRVAPSSSGAGKKTGAPTAGSKAGSKGGKGAAAAAPAARKKRTRVTIERELEQEAPLQPEAHDW
jgi:protein MAK16